MHRTRIRTLAAAAALALTLAGCHYASNPGSSSGGGSGGGLGGAGDVQGGENATQPCTATFQPAGDVTGITVGGSIKGTLWVKCTTPPTEHRLTLELQTKVQGGWATRETRIIDKIPGPVSMPMLITTPCIPGDWQLHWAVTGTVAGKSFAGSATGMAYTVKVSDCA